MAAYHVSTSRKNPHSQTRDSGYYYPHSLGTIGIPPGLRAKVCGVTKKNALTARKAGARHS